MIALIVTMLVAATPAWAQYGFGAYGALRCPTPFAPAAGAVSARDPLLNSEGLVQRGRQDLAVMNAQIQRIDAEILSDHRWLVSMFSEPVFQAIDQHREYARGPGDYSTCPGAPPVAGPALDPSAPGVAIPTPFCVNVGGRVQNYWRDHFVRAGGLVDPSICKMQRDFRGLRAPPSAVQLCLDHLDAFYKHVALREGLRQQRADINARIAAYETNGNAIRAGLTESGRCIGCENLRQAGLEGSDRNALLAKLIQVLLVVLGGISPSALGAQNPLQYPTRPYATARVPGLYGNYGGGYGALPGGVGAGSFAGCPGVAGLGLGGQFVAEPPPFLNGSSRPLFGNLYQNPIYYPNSSNGLFNTGYGRGYGPVVGNGLQGPPVAGLAQPLPSYGYGTAFPGQASAPGRIPLGLAAGANGAPGSIALGQNVLNSTGNVSALLANGGSTFRGLAPGRIPLPQSYSLGAPTSIATGSAYAPGLAGTAVAPTSATLVPPQIIK